MIVPRVMRGAVSMSAGGVIIALLVGNELGGSVGVVLALPAAEDVGAGVLRVGGRWSRLRRTTPSRPKSVEG